MADQLTSEAGATRRRLMPAAARPRDARVDVLRGAALLMIFVDHVPGDWLNLITLHNFGFCDAAEVFVFLAGFSSMMAYGGKFDRDGVNWATLRRIVARCLRIYVVQGALLFLTLFVVWRWSGRYNLPDSALLPLLADGLVGIFRALTLRALPGYIDILPLYIVLLAAFPLIYLAMRKNVAFALAMSALVWVAANIDHGLTLPNSLDDKGWYFNPFTWQLLFTAGAAVAVWMARQGGLLPRRAWLVAPSVAFLAFAFLQGSNWQDWHLPSLRLFAMAAPDKSHLSPLRIADVMALLYLLLSSRAVTSVVALRAVRPLAVCGRHSLEVFAVGCAGALFGRLVTSAYGSGPLVQLAVNGAGIGAMILTAALLERLRVRHGRGTPSDAEPRKSEAGPKLSFQEGDFPLYRPS